MTLVVTHPKVLPGPDDDDPNTVSPTDWNIAHTLTGTADASQLNANVVQSVVNDTNVTGSIAAQALTLGWTGTLALSRFAQGTDGQLVVGQTSAASQYKTLTGALSLTAAGVTALTTSAFANPTGSVGLTAVNGTATTAPRSDGTPALSQAIAPTWTQPHIFNPASGDAITVNPAAATYGKGYNVVQSGSTSTIAGPIAYNKIVATHAGPVTGAAGQFTLLGGRALAFSSTMVLGGASWTSGALGAGEFIAAATVAGIPSGAGDFIGVTGVGYINVTHASTTAGVFGMNPYVFVDTSGSIADAIGMEIDVGIAAGGVASVTRSALRLRQVGATASAGLDSAIIVDNFGVAGGAFKKLLTLRSSVSGVAPLTTTADLFSNDAAQTIGSVFNMPLLTVSTNIFNFPNVGISGAGKAIFGAPIGSLNAAYNVEVTAASSGIIGLSVSTNTTTGSAGINLFDSSGNNNLLFLANEAARTGTIFGVTPGNYAQIASAGSTNLGLLLGTAGAVPLIIGTNNTFAGSVNGSQQWYLGTNHTAPTNTILTVSKNAASPAAAVTATALIQAAGVDSTQPAILLDSYAGANAGNQGFLVVRKGRGTAASFTAALNGDALGYFGMVGAKAANSFADETGAAGGVFFGAVTTENWSGTNQGCHLRIYTTTNGTAAIAETLRLQAPGAILNPGVAVAAGGTAGTGYMMSSTTNLGVFYGSGAPTLSAAQGSIYLRTDGSSTSTRLYVNTNGSTTWTNFTSAA